ncbi:hypothetical protein FACS18942_08410 [Planctomycetales bacterium]|nr:hypothetical protein FACS18942_08410 [Planctomycetales bacterium]
MRASEDFKEVLIPEVRRLLGSQRNPWELLDIEAIQELVSGVFPEHLDYTVTEGDHVHRLVRLRHNIRKHDLQLQ